MLLQSVIFPDCPGTVSVTTFESRKNFSVKSLPIILSFIYRTNLRCRFKSVHKNKVKIKNHRLSDEYCRQALITNH
jgi:hypothetical protein